MSLVLTVVQIFVMVWLPIFRHADTPREFDYQLNSSIASIEISVCKSNSFSFSGGGEFAKVDSRQLETMLELRLENIGSTPIIVSKPSLAIVGVKITEDVDGLTGRRSKTLIDAKITSSQLDIPKNLEYLEGTWFRRLRQNESETFSLHSSILVGKEVLDKMVGKKLIAHYRILTWKSNANAFNEVAAKWKDRGEVVRSDQLIGPYPFMIDPKTERLLDDCSSQERSPRIQ